ncbi:hypothetical protein M2352_004972 [Azospirillum fermentarium]|uniref:hypothetical protein n=1 Tax=Azospirillum fermentarium TaxID=1233114 RepID=UPI00222634A7|nr:hypothetical protein [Azospirillum fermentarium]MCW2249312.1 hypothetical protein [Azospirillum fermentarium]
MIEPFVTMVVRLPAAALTHGVPVLVITAEAVVIVIPASQGAVLLDPDVPREHVLLRLAEEEVREEIRTVIEADGTLTRLAPEMVGDADIHAACRAVASNTDLSEEHGAARFRAALAAIRAAENRLGCLA